MISLSLSLPLKLNLRWLKRELLSPQHSNEKLRYETRSASLFSQFAFYRHLICFSSQTKARIEFCTWILADTNRMQNRSNLLQAAISTHLSRLKLGVKWSETNEWLIGRKLNKSDGCGSLMNLMIIWFWGLNHEIGSRWNCSHSEQDTATEVDQAIGLSEPL